MATRASINVLARSIQKRRIGFRQMSTSAAEVRDGPEVGILRACVIFAGGMAIFTFSQELVSPGAGSFFNINLRGDVDKQMLAAERAVAKGRLLLGEDAAHTGRQTWWWRLAHARENNTAKAPSTTSLWSNTSTNSTSSKALPSPSSLA